MFRVARRTERAVSAKRFLLSSRPPRLRLLLVRGKVRSPSCIAQAATRLTRPFALWKGSSLAFSREPRLPDAWHARRADPASSLPDALSFLFVCSLTLEYSRRSLRSASPRITTRRGHRSTNRSLPTQPALSPPPRRADVVRRAGLRLGTLRVVAGRAPGIVSADGQQGQSP